MRRWPKLTDKNLLKARKVLFDVVDLLENEKIDYHLEGGTLLGLVRDKELLPWDHDVDLSISIVDSERFARKSWRFYLKGYKVSKHKFNKDIGAFKIGQYRIFKIKPIFLSLIINIFPYLKKFMVVADIFVKANDDKFTYWQAMDKIMRVDKKYYSGSETIEYLGIKFKAPSDYKDYLSEKYGDWKIPVKDWDCGRDEKTIVGDALKI